MTNLDPESPAAQMSLYGEFNHKTSHHWNFQGYQPKHHHPTSGDGQKSSLPKNTALGSAVANATYFIDYCTQ